MLSQAGITPHPARHHAITKTGKRRKSFVDDTLANDAGYRMSQTRRKMIECVFGWGKQHGTMRKTKLRGCAKVETGFMINLIAYNLIRIPKLIGA